MIWHHLNKSSMKHYQRKALSGDRAAGSRNRRWMVGLMNTTGFSGREFETVSRSSNRFISTTASLRARSKELMAAL